MTIKIDMDKKITIGWEAIPYILLIVALFLVPRDVSILKEINRETITATSWTVIFALVVFGSSVGLSFDGFMRISRYRMSRYHRFLNSAVSLAGALIPFAVIIVGPYATLMAYVIMAYSYYISPRDMATVMHRKFYQRKYFAYLVNAVLLGTLLILIVFTG